MSASTEFRPKLRSGVRLQWDETRAQDLLLVPEGAVMLNASAAEVLKLCDGARTEAEIVSVLESRYPGSDLGDDVHQLLEGIASKGFVVDAST